MLRTLWMHHHRHHRTLTADLTAVCCPMLPSTVQTSVENGKIICVRVYRKYVCLCVHFTHFSIHSFQSVSYVYTVYISIHLQSTL